MVKHNRSGQITHHTDGIHCQLRRCVVDRRHQYTGRAANHTGVNTLMWHDEFITGHWCILGPCEKRQSHIRRAEGRGTSRYKTETITCQSVTLHSHRALRTEWVACFDIRNALYKKHKNYFFLYLPKPVVTVMWRPVSSPLLWHNFKVSSCFLAVSPHRSYKVIKVPAAAAAVLLIHFAIIPNTRSFLLSRWDKMIRPGNCCLLWDLSGRNSGQDKKYIESKISH